MKNLAGGSFNKFQYEQNSNKLSDSDNIIRAILLNAAKNNQINNIEQFQSKFDFSEFEALKKNNFSPPKKKKIYKKKKIK